MHLDNRASLTAGSSGDREKPSFPATPPSHNVSPSSVPPSPVRPQPGRTSPESPSSCLRLEIGSPGSPTRPPPPALPSHLLPQPPGAAPFAAVTTVRPPRPSQSPMGPPRPTRPSQSPMGPPLHGRQSPSPRRAASSSSLARPQLVMSEQLPFCFSAANRYRRCPSSLRSDTLMVTGTISSARRRSVRYGVQGTAVKAAARGTNWPRTEVCLKLMRVEKRVSWERERDAYSIVWRPDPEHPDGRHPRAKFLLKYFESFESGPLEHQAGEYIAVRVPGVLAADLGVAGRVNKKGGLKGFMGTPGYMAPEITREKTCRYRMSMDMYSLGVLVHTLVCFKPPEKSDTTSEPVNAIDIDEKLPAEGLGRGEGTCGQPASRGPEKRWTIQVLDHIFFRKVQEHVNAKGSLELEEGIETKEEEDGGVRVEEGDPVPAVENKTGEAGCASEAAALEKAKDGVEKKFEDEVGKKANEEFGRRPRMRLRRKVKENSVEKKD
ncbi:hypothetical protein K457DRAFT_20130 [Linnemannia elongata AG-77]|uniref:Protein kinase domain-containing protein n=1 Tax=Linnemannia elongata AG-77 TaxID=1314771 RepID=A0A197JTP1_9FUNG|nr:hypothetical protein K457DRAFT_20130 [Linnemannia elongata AG-77]